MSSNLAARVAPHATVEHLLASLRRDPALAGRMAAVREMPERAAAEAELPPGLPESLRSALVATGRDRLYAHQREAIDHVAAGRNVVIATETSSGKTLAFQIPVLAATMRDPEAHALFIFPTNPLANDQEASLAALLARIPERDRPRPHARLQGGQGAEKDRIAAGSPQIVLTNPEMVHLYLLPRHRQWARFWRGLRYIVVDEIHLYRGAFGGHLANLLRRVRRCAWRYGGKPQVIAASATVGNPRALAEELCSAPFELVDRSTAPRGPRTTVLWRTPVDTKGASYLDESVELFRRSLDAGLQSILFARSRQLVEQLVTKVEEATGRSRIQLGVRAYRAGYLREEREVIEQGLRAGTVRGVVTTNALEVGIDIGSLDVCVMAGYPGTLMALRQQAGRVGRRDRASATFLVASANPLDAYLVTHPEAVFGAPSEDAVLGRRNRHVLRSHLACASSEFPLWEAEIERFGGDVARAAAADLVGAGEARWGLDGERRSLVATRPPHRNVSLRSASQERFVLVDPEGDTVGEMDGEAVAREAYPGAIYLHQGRTFRVDRLEDGRIFLAPAPRCWSTRVQGEREVSVRSEERVASLANGLVEAVLGPVDVVNRYTSFLESTGPGRSPRARALDPAVTSELSTEALVLRARPGLRELLDQAGLAPGAALHATEHLLAAFASSLVLCDRDDLEGHTLDAADEASVVLFDRHPGGIGFARAAFDHLDLLVRRAGEAVDECPCHDGCPACVHGGRCLRGNDEVSKRGARFLLRLLRGLPVGDAADRPRAAPVRVRAERPKRHPDFEPRTGEPKGASDKTWAPAFAPGDRVEHASFGEGRVLEVRPSGRVVVEFGDGRARRITPGWLRKA